MPPVATSRRIRRGYCSVVVVLYTLLQQQTRPSGWPTLGVM